VSGSQDKTLKVWEFPSGELISTLKGHIDWVKTCLFLPNSNIVSGSHDHTLKIWDITTIEQNKNKDTVQNDIEESILDANISYDKEWLIIWNNSFAAKFNTVKILDTTDQLNTLYNIPAYHSDCLNHCALSPDKKYLLTASIDKTLKLWNIKDSKEVFTYIGHTNQVRCCAYYHHKNCFVSGSSDKTIRIWDTVSGQCLSVLEGHTDIINSCEISEDDHWLITSSHDKTARVWDLLNLKEVLVLKGHSEPLYYAMFSRDCEYIVTSSQDCTAKVWDFMNCSEDIIHKAKKGISLCKFVLQGHHKGVVKVDISPSKQFILTSSHFQDNTTRVWDFNNGECIALLDGVDTFSAFLSDNSFIALSKTELVPFVFEIITK